MHGRVLASIVVLVGLICLAMMLRRLGVLREQDGPIFSRLVIQITLPALIFVSLAKTVIHWQMGYLALIMLVAELGSLALAWLIGRGFSLSNPKLGAFVLVSGFGSSSLLGYALISQVFVGNTQALTEAVVVSELGVGPALFTLGTMLAMYYGSGKADHNERLKAAMGFFVSPIFIAVIAGIIWSAFSLPTIGAIIGPIFQGLQVLADANTFMVALTVGVLLHFARLREVAVLAAIVCVIKLIMKPVIIWLPTLAMALPDWEVQVLVLEAAMPSALLTVVLCSRYGCDAKLASKLVFATTIISAATIVFMVQLLG